MRVALVALGHSCTEYVEIALGQGGRKRLWDEVWGVNAAGDIIHCDKIFHMDDVKVQEIRAEAGNEKVKEMLRWMKTHPGPIFTSRTYPDYPGLVEYPLEEVVNHLGSTYFNNTVPYAIAYAAHIGVKELYLYGVDYVYGGIVNAEKGKACAEYWIRAAQERGCEVSVASSSTLMDAFRGAPYGYDTEDIKWEAVDGKFKMIRTPKEKLPTAEEMEARYDHLKLARDRGLVT